MYDPDGKKREKKTLKSYLLSDDFFLTGPS